MPADHVNCELLLLRVEERWVADTRAQHFALANVRAAIVQESSIGNVDERCVLLESHFRTLLEDITCLGIPVRDSLADALERITLAPVDTR